MGELTDRFQPRLGIFGQRLVRLVEQKRVRLMVRAADAAAQLIELREAEFVGIVDDHRVDVGMSIPFSMIVVATSTSISPSMNSA